MTKTPEDVARLKKSWSNDPGWDVENTEGFEAYHDELLTYRLAVERQEFERQRGAEVDWNARLDNPLEFLKRQMIVTQDETAETWIAYTHAWAAARQAAAAERQADAAEQQANSTDSIRSLIGGIIGEIRMETGLDGELHPIGGIQVVGAEKQATHLATIAGALNIMLDLITDFVTGAPMVDDGVTEYCAVCDRPLLDDDAHIGDDGEKFHPGCCPECEHQAASFAPEMGTDL